VILPRVPRAGPALRAIVVTTVLTAMLVACGSSRQAARPITRIAGLPPLLTWLGENTHPAGTIYPTLADSARYGSVSGLVRDAQSGEWVGVIDDRAGTRVAWLSIQYTGGRLQVSPTRLMPLSAGPGVDVDRVTKADLEAITALPDGTFMMSEEGHREVDGGALHQPAMLHVTREGVVTDLVDYPKAFQIQDDTHGLRDNLGFESLTRLPDGRLIAGLEQPLIEDGPETTFERGGRGRLIAFELRDGAWRPGREWIYMINPAPRIEGFPTICKDGANGLVDVLALSDTTLLSMERACLQDPATQAVADAIQIFFVELEGTEARKTRILDLSTLVPKLSPALAHLDNFEALAFGPPAPGVAGTLLVASDDNFRPTQKSSFLLFGLR
jgi:hypothetical protein